MRFAEWLAHKRMSRVHENFREVMNKYILSDIRFYRCDGNIYQVIRYLKTKNVPEEVADLVVIEWANFLKHRRRDNLRLFALATSADVQPSDNPDTTQKEKEDV